MSRDFSDFPIFGGKPDEDVVAFAKEIRAKLAILKMRIKSILQDLENAGDDVDVNPRIKDFVVMLFKDEALTWFINLGEAVVNQLVTWDAIKTLFLLGFLGIYLRL